MLKIASIGLRDLLANLSSFSYYLLLTIFFGIAGYFFWSNISYFSLISFQAATNPRMQVQGLNLIDGVLSPFLSNLSVLMLLLITILTMRSFSEEKKAGTLELLFSYPISDVQVVVGKFLGLLALVMLMIIPTIFYFQLAAVVGAKFETATLCSGYFGLVLMSSSFIALGMFVSSLTDNQAISAGIGFSIILFFWIVGWMADWTSPALGAIFKELALTEHFYDLTRGVLDTRDVGFFILFSLFFLFATLCSIEVKTWKR
jgi:ABC-2 type transport system permease protein